MEKARYEIFNLPNEDCIQAIRCWIGRRYKIFQIIGCYNAAVLTFGVISKKIILNADDLIWGMSVCMVSFLVALLGFSAEFSTAPNKFHWLRVPHLLKNELGEVDIKGVLKREGKSESKRLLPPKFPIYRERRFFYFFLMIFWVLLAYLTIT